jgi:hypothetical protein
MILPIEQHIFLNFHTNIQVGYVPVSRLVITVICLPDPDPSELRVRESGSVRYIFTYPERCFRQGTLQI